MSAGFLDQLVKNKELVSIVTAVTIILFYFIFVKNFLLKHRFCICWIVRYILKLSRWKYICNRWLTDTTSCTMCRYTRICMRCISHAHLVSITTTKPIAIDNLRTAPHCNFNYKNHYLITSRIFFLYIIPSNTIHNFRTLNLEVRQSLSSNKLECPPFCNNWS